MQRNVRKLYILALLGMLIAKPCIAFSQDYSEYLDRSHWAYEIMNWLLASGHLEQRNRGNSESYGIGADPQIPTGYEIKESSFTSAAFDFATDETNTSTSLGKCLARILLMEFRDNWTRLPRSSVMEDKFEDRYGLTFPVENNPGELNSSDVTRDHWAYIAMQHLLEMSGDFCESDRYADPELHLTIAEFRKAIDEYSCCHASELGDLDEIILFILDAEFQSAFLNESNPYWN